MTTDLSKTTTFTVGVTPNQVEDILKRMMSVMWNFHRPGDPQDFTKLVLEWHNALNFTDTKFPPSIYDEAVTSFLAEATAKTYPPLPGDIIAHCKKVMEKIKTDPVRGPKMQEWQQQRREHRVALLTGGVQ